MPPIANSDIKQEINSLNPEQREAALHVDGPMLVLAGAGSGKTRVITVRTANLLEIGISPKNILNVTFTNKAAKEMKERLKGLTKPGQAKGLIVSTFHSLGLRILRESAHHLGYDRDFSIYDMSDQLSLIRHILNDIKYPDKNFKIEWILARISLTKNTLLSKGEKAQYGDDEIGEVTELVFPKYQKTLRSFNTVDFDDLLLLPVELFNKKSDVLDQYRNKFRYIMVDEYQDTNRVQYILIKLLAGFRKNLCVVGDDDQSIYRWRGADLRNILDFESDFDGTKVVKLEENYRSYGYILQAANGVIANNKHRKEKKLRTRKVIGYKLREVRLEDGEEEATWIVNRISYQKYKTSKPYEHFAIIYRANAFSRPFEEELRKKTIPYTVVGGTSFFEKKEIKDLTAYLKVIANPADDLGLMRASNTPKRGLGLTSVEKMSEHASANSHSLLAAFGDADKIESLSPKIKQNAKNFCDLINRYSEKFASRKNMAGVFNELIDEIDYNDYILSLYKTPKAVSNRLENIKDFVGSLEAYEKDNSEASLQNFLENLALTDLLKSKDDDMKKSGVTLISIHSAKGLEFPVVFIAGLEDDVLPHKKSITEKGGIEEERRLFYVGITRAMEELYLTYAKTRKKYGQMVPTNPSRFLEEIPREVVCRMDRLTEDADDDEMDNEEAGKAFFANMRKMLRSN